VTRSEKGQDNESNEAGYDINNEGKNKEEKKKNAWIDSPFIQTKNKSYIMTAATPIPIVSAVKETCDVDEHAGSHENDQATDKIIVRKDHLVVIV
jgi:hypothetical protein